jgi:hypothetical protein
LFVLTDEHNADEDWLAADQEVFRAVSEHFRHDLRAFWEQSAFFMGIEAGLLAVFVVTTSEHRNDIEALIFAGFGVVVALFWMYVGNRRAELIDKWRGNAIAIDRVIDRHRFYVELESGVRSSRFGGPTKFTSYLPWVVLVAWLFLVPAFLFGAGLHIGR